MGLQKGKKEKLLCRVLSGRVRAKVRFRSDTMALDAKASRREFFHVKEIVKNIKREDDKVARQRPRRNYEIEEKK